MTISFPTNIISAVRNILISDTTEPDTGHCIDYFVPADKIVHAGTPNTVLPPFISLWFEMGETHLGLPSQKGEMTINCFYNEKERLARTKIEQLSSRIIHLLDKKPDVLNSQGFETKVKSFRKIKAFSIPPEDSELYQQLLIFAVILSNE